MRINISKLTHEEFLKLRTGIGGSDAGAILDLSEYVSRYELWGVKTGLYQKRFSDDNNASFFGRYFEKHIAELYTYWDGSFEGMMENYKAGKRVSKIERNIYHYTDRKLPFLQCSPDRIIKEHYKYKGKGVLEVKTILGFVANRYEAGIPPMYYAQMQHNLMVTNLKWGEFVILKDGRNFDVFHIERNDDFIATLKEAELDFWNSIEKTREAVAKGESYSEFEPDVDGSQAFAEFLKAQYKGQEATIYAQPDDMENIAIYDTCNKQIKEIEKKKQLAQNNLMYKMKEATVMVIDDYSKITFRPDVKGNRRFVLKYR